MTKQEVLLMDNAAWGISELADGTIVEADTGALLVEPLIEIDQMFRVSWEFRNGHQWFKDFRTVEARDLFTKSVGLVGHPDIYRVTFSVGQENRDELL